MREVQDLLSYLKRCRPAPFSHWGHFKIIQESWNLPPPYAAVRRPDKSDFNPTLNVPAGNLVGFFPLRRKADGDTFQCLLHLDPNKAIY